MKYRNHDLHGFLVVDKPLGLSSMEVVRRVRRAGGHCKTGHAGTLDPLATGVVICCLGRGTKYVEKIMTMKKVYRAEVDLSSFSSTDDEEGEKTLVSVDVEPTLSALTSQLASLTGEIDQVPPIYSAIKVSGKRAYDLARSGREVTLKSRRVHIEAIELIDYQWPIAQIIVRCGRGTYIRSLARQIGEGLGVGGYLRSLRRTSIGPWCLDANGVSLESVAATPLEQSHLISLEAMDAVVDDG